MHTLTSGRPPAAAVRTTDMKCSLKKLEVFEQCQHGEAAPLKTAHSYAVIPMGSFLLDRYMAHMERRTAPPSASALRHRKRSGWTPRPDEYDQLVTVTRRGTPLRPNTLSEVFNRAKAKARAKGVQVPDTATFRDLRDFMHAVLIAAGVPPAPERSGSDEARDARRDTGYVRLRSGSGLEERAGFFRGVVRHPGACGDTRGGLDAALTADVTSSGPGAPQRSPARRTKQTCAGLSRYRTGGQEDRRKGGHHDRRTHPAHDQRAAMRRRKCARDVHADLWDGTAVQVRVV